MVLLKLSVVFALLCALRTAHGSIRVAVVSDFTSAANGQGDWKGFIEGIEFAARHINASGGISVGAGKEFMELVPYDYFSAADFNEVVTAISSGVNLQSQPVGDIHAIVMASSKENAALISVAEAAGIPNIHASGGNPTMWSAANSFAFGMHVPFVTYTQGPIRVAKLRGLQTIAILRSKVHGFSTASCIASLNWAIDAGLTVIGPSLLWCQQWADPSGNGPAGSCRKVNGACRCGQQSEVDQFDYKYNISEVPGFYEVNEGAIGNGVAWGEIDANTTAFFQSIVDDIRNQLGGERIDVLHNHVVEWHNALNALVKADYSPKMLLGWQGGVSTTWAVPTAGTEMLDEVHGYWAIGFGQWHYAMTFTDPVFGSNAAAVRAWKAELGYDLGYNPAGAVAAGVVLATAISKYAPSDLGSLGLTEKRNAIRRAIGDMNDETLWGTVRFNRKNQNNGRSSAAWQIIPDSSLAPQKLCVLPAGAAEVEPVIPFPSWKSRFGCPPGNYNSGSECLPCPMGSVEANTTTGLVPTVCSRCPAGKGSQTVGLTMCTLCAAGKKQDGLLDGGICYNCTAGSEAPSEGASVCISCFPGRAAPFAGSSSCQACSTGRYQGRPQQTECLRCDAGRFTNTTMRTTCALCPTGTYQGDTGKSFCEPCLPPKTTNSMGLASQDQCQCPAGTYLASSTGTCMSCPEGMTCTFGSSEANFGNAGVKPRVKPGYYTDALRPLDVFLCEKDTGDVGCPGGDPGTCGQGRMGLVCARCRDGFAPGGSGECQKCSDGIIGVVFILFIIFLCLIVAIYHLSNGSVRVNASVTLTISVLVGLGITMCQVLGTLPELSVVWPHAANEVTGSMAFFLMSPDTVMSSQCLSNDATTMFFLRCLQPVVCVIAVVFLFLLSRIASFARPRLAWTVDKTVNTTCQLLQAVFIGIVILVSSPLQCYSHPNGKYSLSMFPEILCWESEHMPILVAGFLIALTFVIPFIALCVWANVTAVHRLATVGKTHAVRFRFLLYRFRPDMWWWGNIFLVRTVLLAFAPSVPADSPHWQIMFICIVTIAYLVAQCCAWPWMNAEMNLLDVGLGVSISLISSTSTAFLHAERDNPSYGAMVMVFIVMFFTYLAILFFLCLYWGAKNGPDGAFGNSRVWGKTQEDIAYRWIECVKLTRQIADEELLSLITVMNKYDQMKVLSTISCFQAISPKIFGKSITSRLCTLDHTERRSFHRASRLSINSGESGDRPAKRIVEEEV